MLMNNISNRIGFLVYLIHTAPILTVETHERPVAAGVQGPICQLEGKGAGVGYQVGVAGCDVDAVGLGPLAHLHLRGENVRRIVVDVQQVYLQGACATGRGVSWKETHHTGSNT